MPTIVCYQAESAQADAAAWRRITGPEFLSEQQGTLFVQLPQRGRYRAFVNGLDVVGGIQVVERGDLVRVLAPNGTEIAYVVGRVLASVEPGDGRACQFTGKSITGQAIACWGCSALFAKEVAEQLGNCPVCKEPFGDHDDRPPEEELL